MNRYFTNFEKNRKRQLCFYDGLIVFFVFALSYAIRVAFYEKGGLWVLSERISWLVAPGVIIHLLAFYVFGLYDTESTRRRKLLLINVFLSVFSATVLITLFSFAFPADRIGRILMGIQLVLMTLIFYGWRIAYAKKSFQNDVQGVVIIGWSPLVDKIADHLRRQNAGYALRGVVIPASEESPAGVTGNPVPVFECLDEALMRTGAQTVVIAKNPRYLEEFNSALLDLKFRSVDIFAGPAFYEYAFGRVPVSEISESWLLYGFKDGRFQPPLYIQVKRLFDVAASILVLVGSLPLFLIVSLLIRLDSKGPVFFKQERLGLNERLFMLYKFRTMIDNAEKETGPCWACAEDHRFTRIGKFLRKTRLDEFPQFINVLRGEMSLVGPRPIRKHFADIFSAKFPFYRLRFKVKPGITGWAQVNMDYVNTEQDQYEKLEYELYYLYHQSVFLDLFIALKTVQSMLRMRGG